MQRTPLHIAVKKFRVKTAEFLVDNQADINSQDNDGVSLLSDVYILQCSLSLSFLGTHKRVLHTQKGPAFTIVYKLIINTKMDF